MSNLLFGILIGTIATLIGVSVSRNGKVLFTEEELEKYTVNAMNKAAASVIEDLVTNPDKYEQMQSKYIEIQEKVNSLRT